MAAELIGIEIGSSTLKLAQVKHSQLHILAAYPLPRGLMENGRITDPAALAAIFRSAWKSHGIRGRDCALVLPPQSVLSQHLTMPILDRAALEARLPLAFQDYLEGDSAQYAYDYIVTGIHGESISLYAAAVRQDLVETYWDIFHKAGLRLRLAIPREMAWRNLLIRQAMLPEKLAILDLGHSATRIHIFAGTHYIMEKELSSAHAFAQSWDALVSEIRKAINFYNYSLSPGETPLKTLYYCGDYAGTEALREAMACAGELSFHPITHLPEFGGNALAMHCAIAAGAAVQGL